MPPTQSPFFAVIALIGMWMSTKVHREDGSTTREKLSLTAVESDFTDEASTHLL